MVVLGGVEGEFAEISPVSRWMMMSVVDEHACWFAGVFGAHADVVHASAAAQGTKVPDPFDLTPCG